MSSERTEAHDRPEQTDASGERPTLAAIVWGMAVVIGPSLVLDIFAAASTLAVVSGRAFRRREGLAKLLRPLAILGTALPWAYMLLIRPRHMRWGATDEEVEKPLPGDEFVPDPGGQSTRAITIDASVEEVWPWLAQVGQDRGGYYSYEWLENLAGSRMRNVDRVHPEWQQREVGETVYVMPAFGHKVLAFEASRAMVLEGWGAFVVEPIDEKSTRVILRSRGQRGLNGAFYHPLVGEFPHFVMERGMLKGLKRRAERTTVGLEASQRFQRETVINRPVEEVFDFVTDARNEPRYNPRILSAQKTTSGPIGPGAHFVLMSKAMGRPIAVEYEITAYERPRRMISHTIRGLPLMDVESVETFEPVADGTRMRWEWEVRPQGTAGRMLTPVLARMLTSRLEGALTNIKRVLEGETPAVRMDERM